MSTSAPWKVTINNAYFIWIIIFFASWQNISTFRTTIASTTCLGLWCIISNERRYQKERGSRTHFRPTFLPRGINTEFKIYLVIYQLFWTQAYPEGMCTNRTQVPCEMPSLPDPTTRKGWPYYRGLRPLLFSNSDVGSFTSHKNKSLKVLCDGTYGFRPYPRRLESLIIYRYRYKGSTFFSVN